MKTPFWKALGTVSLLLIVGSVSAQDAPKPASSPDTAVPRPERGQGRGGQYGRNGRLTLITVPAAYLKSELSLGEDQAAKIEAVQTKAQEEMKAARASFTPGDPAAMREAAAKLQEANKKYEDDIKAILTDDQREKVPALMKDTQALVSAGIPVTAISDLKLTSDQKKKISDLADEMQTKLKDVPREERRTKGQELRTALHTDAMAVLTDTQKEALAKSAASAKKAKKDKADKGEKTSE